MKYSLPILILALAAFAQPVPQEPPLPTATYRFGLLKRGPAWTPTRTPRTDSIQAGHMANIHRMAEHGALIGAGPFLHGGLLRGVFIFRDDTSDVRAMAARDPAIESGRLVLDLCTLQAQPGVGEPYRAWKRDGGADSMVTHRLVLLRPGPKARAGALPATERQARREWIERGIRERRLALAGDVAGADSLSGIHVVRGDSSAAATLVAADPAVRSGRFTAEILPWMCGYGVMPGDTLVRPPGR